MLAQSARNCRAVIVSDIATALAVSNRYAPEHLIIQTAAPRALLDGVQNAGSVFLGAWSPESMGDYCSGTNHVLPTYGYARAYSGLSLADFQKRVTVQELTAAGLARLGPVAQTLADLEGLDGHARAVTVRLATLAQGAA
ncbi:MAG: histidinol dehydrogenase [Steroidobacteraceae bacterium]